MHAKTLLTGIAAATLLALTPAAQAAPKSFWFECTGALPLQTLDVETYSWSETAPTASYQEGEGCGWLDSPFKGTAQPNPLYDAGFGGAYNGEVRKLEITLYAPYNDTLSNKTADFLITADGEEIVNATAATPVLGPVGSSGATAAFTYTFTGVDLAARRSARDYVIAVAGTYLDDTPGWLFGAAEIPSNIKFYAFEDLTPEEQAEIRCIEDETLCTQ